MKKLLLNVLIIICLVSCVQQPADKTASQKPTWKNQLDEKLPLLGHRNWILIVDQAFPEQSNPAMQYVNTNEKLADVLNYTLTTLGTAKHVKPILYRDRELHFIEEKSAPGVSKFKSQLDSILKGRPVNEILHDSVFVKIDKVAKLFSVLVLKTTETIPYTSVFIELDCAYWGAEKEAELRSIMRK